MNRILISADSRYPITRPKIKKAIESVLREQKVTSEVEISVLVCGTRKAADLARKYLNDPKPHNVLSFPFEEKVSAGADGLLMLGDIAVCYPIAQEEATRDNIMLDVKINELVTHGLLHLLGEHHE